MHLHRNHIDLIHRSGKQKFHRHFLFSCRHSAVFIYQCRQIRVRRDCPCIHMIQIVLQTSDCQLQILSADCFCQPTVRNVQKLDAVRIKADRLASDLLDIRGYRYCSVKISIRKRYVRRKIFSDINRIRHRCRRIRQIKFLCRDRDLRDLIQHSRPPCNFHRFRRHRYRSSLFITIRRFSYSGSTDCDILCLQNRNGHLYAVHIFADFTAGDFVAVCIQQADCRINFHIRCHIIQRNIHHCAAYRIHR